MMVLKKILGLCCFQETQKDNVLELDVTETAALTTVHCGEKPVVDIVAIHGLNGHAVKSFTAEKTQSFWLGDGDMLPRDLRNSRIMTFSYQASVAALFDRTSSDTFLQHATTLAQELAAYRSALIYAESRKEKKMEHVHALFVSTYAMLFFGTPHNGSSRANLASYAQRMVSSLMPSKMIDTDSQLLNALKDGSEILQEITDNFQPKMKRFHVFFFWEQLKTDLGAKYDYGDGLKGISALYELLHTQLQQMRSEIAYLQANLQDSAESLRAESTEPVRKDETPADCASPFSINVHYLVRRRSDFFVGRQEAAADLRRRFGSEICKKPKIFVIYGFPGSGKTQFCLKYLEDSWERYWGVFWIDCSSEANAESSYASISRHAGRGGGSGAGIQWLSQTSKPWLLVLDNANTPEMDLSAFLPRSGNDHILVTTRNPDIKMYNTIGTLLFRGMDPEEAIVLLLRLAYPDREVHFVSQEYREPAQTIAMELGYLALDLKQAASVIRQNLLPLEKYLKSLLMCRKSLLSRPSITCAAEANIIATWELPFADITSRTTTWYVDAVDLIHLLAFMHFASIPHVLFSRSSDNVKMLQQLGVHIPMMTELTSAQEVEVRVRQAARVLYEHSIISFASTEDSPISYPGAAKTVLYLSLHPAIHQWARDRLNQEKQRQWLDCVGAIIASSFPIDMETSGATFRRQLLPHIGACISFTESAYTTLPISFDQASNMEKFGLVYAENEFWRRARALQQKVAA
ncbi:hypothetical protein PG994_008802 [Apiospora phragmitis]|uniref:NB-ARC domain-containing protein n=1 Tax=Apiospora phragmitis TaxID=2905665 RepID=A0ABR1UKI3_9PEZI